MKVRFVGENDGTCVPVDVTVGKIYETTDSDISGYKLSIEIYDDKQQMNELYLGEYVIVEK